MSSLRVSVTSVVLSGIAWVLLDIIHSRDEVAPVPFPLKMIDFRRKYLVR